MYIFLQCGYFESSVMLRSSSQYYVDPPPPPFIHLLLHPVSPHCCHRELLVVHPLDSGACPQGWGAHTLCDGASPHPPGCSHARASQCASGRGYHQWIPQCQSGTGPVLPPLLFCHLLAIFFIFFLLENGQAHLLHVWLSNWPAWV